MLSQPARSTAKEERKKSKSIFHLPCITITSTSMKGIDLLCASPASTAICVGTDHQSMVRHGGRKLDRHNPHLRDGRRSKTTVPSSSQLPGTKPKPHHHHHPQKSRKSSSPKPPDDNLLSSSPAGSSRYLLSDSAFYDVLSEFEPISALIPAEPTIPQRPTLDDQLDDFPAREGPPSSSSLNPSLSNSTSTATSSDQVVVLRVSLHCKGCEGKVRKHISRMKDQLSTSYTLAITIKGMQLVLPAPAIEDSKNKLALNAHPRKRGKGSCKQNPPAHACKLYPVHKMMMRDRSIVLL